MYFTCWPGLQFPSHGASDIVTNSIPKIATLFFFRHGIFYTPATSETTTYQAMSSQASRDSLFDCFFACRAPGDVPSEFDLMMLDAVLAMGGVAQQQPVSPARTTLVTTIAPLSPSSQYYSFGVTRCPDRLFPISLLKCPLGVFLSFCKRHHLQSTLVTALQDARRRKTNRKFQRVTRNRRRG